MIHFLGTDWIIILYAIFWMWGVLRIIEIIVGAGHTSQSQHVHIPRWDEEATRDILEISACFQDWY